MGKDAFLKRKMLWTEPKEMNGSKMDHQKGVYQKVGGF